MHLKLSKKKKQMNKLMKDRVLLKFSFKLLTKQELLTKEHPLPPAVAALLN